MRVKTRILTEAQLLDLNIPVAELIPEKLPQGLRDLMKAVLLAGAIYDFGAAVEAAENPSVLDRHFTIRQRFRFVPVGFLRHPRLHSRAFHVEEQKSSRIPDLVGEVACRFHAVFARHYVGARSSRQHQREPHRIGPIFLGDRKRVDRIAARLRHFLPLGIADQAVNIHVMERHFARAFQSHHDHARDPEEDNIEARDQHRRRIVFLQILRVIRPAQRRKRPQSGAEPRIQDIRVLF